MSDDLTELRGAMADASRAAKRLLDAVGACRQVLDLVAVDRLAASLSAGAALPPRPMAPVPCRQGPPVDDATAALELQTRAIERAAPDVGAATIVAPPGQAGAARAVGAPCPEVAARRDLVRRHIREGLAAGAVANLLGLKLKTVTNDVARMGGVRAIRGLEAPPVKRAPPVQVPALVAAPGARPEVTQRRAAIAKVIRGGATIPEAADALKLPRGIVTADLQRMGGVSALRTLLPRGGSASRAPKPEADPPVRPPVKAVAVPPALSADSSGALRAAAALIEQGKAAERERRAAAAADVQPVADMTEDVPLADRGLHRRLDRLGSFGERDLQNLDMLERLTRGEKAADVAAALKIARDKMVMRFRNLIPDPTIEKQKDMIRVLKWRIERARADG